MSQNLIYGPHVALEVARLAARDCHEGGLIKDFFGWSISLGFFCSSQRLADVFYLTNGEIKKVIGSKLVETPGLFVHALDNGVHVRRWMFVETDADFDSNVQKAQALTDHISQNYGKVGIADILPTKNSQGLFSINFPKKDGSFYRESVPYEISTFFEKTDFVLANIRKNYLS